jgi:hypothetical protein
MLTLASLWSSSRWLNCENERQLRRTWWIVGKPLHEWATCLLHCCPTVALSGMKSFHLSYESECWQHKLVGQYTVSRCLDNYKLWSLTWFATCSPWFLCCLAILTADALMPQLAMLSFTLSDRLSVSMLWLVAALSWFFIHFWLFLIIRDCNWFFELRCKGSILSVTGCTPDYSDVWVVEWNGSFELLLVPKELYVGTERGCAGSWWVLLELWPPLSWQQLFGW